MAKIGETTDRLAARSAPPRLKRGREIGLFDNFDRCQAQALGQNCPAEILPNGVAERFGRKSTAHGANSFWSHQVLPHLLVTPGTAASVGVGFKPTQSWTGKIDADLDISAS